MTPTLNEANLFKIAVRDEKSKQKTAMTVGTKKDPKNFFSESSSNFSVTLTKKSQSIWKQIECLEVIV